MPRFKKQFDDSHDLVAPLWQKYHKEVFVSLLMLIFFVLVFHQIKLAIHLKKDQRNLINECILYQGECAINLPQQRTIDIKMTPALPHSGELTHVYIQTTNLDISTSNLIATKLSSTQSITVNTPLHAASPHQVSGQLSFGVDDANTHTWLMIIHLVSTDNTDYAIPVRTLVAGKTDTLYNAIETPVN